MKYRNLSRWKYQLMEDHVADIPVHGIVFENDFIALEKGMLLIRKGYCWDGASGPTFDTLSTMRASLVHDALYQLIREGVIGMPFRRFADKLFYKMLREDGMGRLRAWYFYRAVRQFGESSAKPRKAEPVRSAP